MPAATSKVILYSQTPSGKTLLTHPVAIFANAKDAKAFATYMRLAHRASDVPAAVALDPLTDLTEEGTIRQGTKWSILEVRYAPSPSFPEDEAAEVEPAAS